MTKKYSELSRKKQEEILRPEVLKIIRELGGYASKKEIIHELKTSSDVIPEEYIDHRIETSKGRTYAPFNFVYNLGVIKAFEIAEFLTRPKQGYVKLTEKGRTFDISNHSKLQIEVNKYTDPYWKQKAEERKKEDSGQQIEETNEEELEEKIGEEELRDESWKLNLRKTLEDMTPHKFEIFARALVKEMGVDIDEKIGIQRTADEGLDGFGYITANDFRTSRVAIQAKRWKGKVPSPEIDKFRGAMDKYNAEYGVFITTSVFSRPAIKASREGTRVITLIDGEEIADLVEKYELYVKKVQTYELDDFFTDKN